MPDYTQINRPTVNNGPKIATDEISDGNGNLLMHQRVKVQHGADGTATDVSSTAPLPVTQNTQSEVPLILSRFLDTTGDGTGTKEAIGNYSGSPQIFRIQPPSGQVYRINRLIMHLDDSGNLAAAGYGAGSVLMNGIKVSILDNVDGDIVDLTDGLPVRSNGDWSSYCYDVTPIDFGGGANMLTFRWTFAKSGTVIRLDGDAGESLGVTFNDDLTGLVQHRFMAQGYIEGTTT